jgi:MFS family permease
LFKYRSFSAFFSNFAAENKKSVLLNKVLRGMTVSLNHLSDLVRKRVAVAAYYFVPGVVFASWASRIPDVKQMLHLSNGQLGTVLFAIPIGQLLMMAFSGVLVSKFGSRKMILLAEVLYAHRLLFPPLRIALLPLHRHDSSHQGRDGQLEMGRLRRRLHHAIGMGSISPGLPDRKLVYLI